MTTDMVVVDLDPLFGGYKNALKVGSRHVTALGIMTGNWPFMYNGCVGT